MKKIFLLFGMFIGLAHLNVHSQDKAGIFLEDWEARGISVKDFTETTKPNATPTVTVTADYNNVVTKVSKYIFGNNANDYSGKYNLDPGLVRDVDNLAPNIIRFPGGNNANWYFWNHTTGKLPTDIPAIDINSGKKPPYLAGRTTENWRLSISDYYQFLHQTNSTGMITVNYSYARYGTSQDPVATAAKYAADWVRYDNGRTKYWEVGNENYGNWQAGYQIDEDLNKDKQPVMINGDLYGRHFKVFADSMRQAAKEIGATIYIGAVAYEETNFGGVIGGWNDGVFPHVKDKADFLVVHNYYQIINSTAASAEILDKAVEITKKQMTDLDAVMLKNKYDKFLPLAMTEWNINAINRGQMLSDVNGIHSDIALGEMIKQGFGMASRWGLVNHYGGGNDHGVFAKQDPRLSEYTPYPVFYHMYYFQKFFGDQMVSTTTTGSNDILAYASKFGTTGQASFVVINKGLTESVVKLNVDNFKYGTRYYVYTLSGDSTEFSKKVYVNGVTTTRVAGGPADYQAIKPASSVIDNNIIIKAPARSTSYILVESGEIPKELPLTSLRISKDTLYVSGGQTYQLNVKAFDDAQNSYNVTPQWTVTGEGDVNERGLYMASYPGTYIVKATYANLSDTAVIIVNQPKSLVITPPADTIEVGYTGTFTAYGLDASGNKVMVNPVWSANVDARGVFKATQVGVYQVIARQGKLADTAIVTVIPVKSCTEYNLGDIIEAENWCHMEGVQTEPSGDVGLGINVGYIDKGDWMEYWLKTDTGTYDFNLRVAAMSVVGQVSLLLKGDGDDDTLVSKAPLVITGDWQKWKTVKIRVTFKKAGLRKLVLMTDVGGWNLNWIQITPLSPPTIDMTKYVNISPKTATIELGYNQKFTAQAYDKNMFKIDALPSWSLSAPSSIDASGLFTPVKAGNYKVYAMVGNVKDSVNVLVIPAKVCVETRFGVKAEAEKWCHMSGITSELSKDGDSIVKFEGNTTWAEYVLVTEPGTFEINARIFTREPVKTTIVIKDAVIDTLVSSFNMLGTVSSVWKTVKMKATFKTSGLKTIRISSTGGIWKLDWLNVLPVSTDNIEAVETKSVSRLFPNPLSGNVVSIESPLFEVNSPVTIQIADIDGREVFKEKTVVLEDGSYSLRLPSKLIHGVYVLAITSSSKLETLKLVVE